MTTISERMKNLRMNLSRGKTGKKILALLLALTVPAGSVCAAQLPKQEGAATGAAQSQEDNTAAGVYGTQGDDPAAKAPAFQTGENGEGSLEEEAQPQKLIRKIETFEEVTRACGEVFTLDVKLTDPSKDEAGDIEDGNPGGGNDAAAGVSVPETEGRDAAGTQTPGGEIPAGDDAGGKASGEPAVAEGSQNGTASGTGGDNFAAPAGQAVPAAGEAAENPEGSVPGSAVPAGQTADSRSLDGEALGEDPLQEEPAKEDTLQYESADPNIAAIEQDESGADCIRAVGVGDTVIKITAPETEQYEKAEAQVLLHVVLPEDGGVFGNALINSMALLPGGSLSAAENIKDGIRLKWAKIEGAESYYLERSSNGKSPWTRIKTSVNADDVTYIDKQVKEGEAYYYRVKAVDQSGQEGLTGASKKIVRLIAPSLSVSLAGTGTELKWNRVKGCSGYYVYRREASQNDWAVASTITQPGEISWRDTAAGNGATYIYSVRAYKGSSFSDYAGSKSYMRVTAPTVKKFKRKSATKFKLTWKTNPVATGYQIQYSQNGMFVGAKKVTVKKAKASSYTLSGLSKNKGYYARIRAYKKVGKTTYYSSWSAASNVKKTRTAKATPLTKKNKMFELRAQAKQKMFQYDTLQGSCTDGTFAYYLMYNRKAVNCKIVKVRRSNLKVEQVSGVLDVAHGNDMTYDSSKNRLVIVHSTGSDPKKLTSVDPKTLAVIESKHVQIPKKLAGGSIADAAGATAFSGVAYSSGRKQYAVLLSHNYNFVVLDADLEPVRYVKASKKNNYVVQGIDATDDYILVAQSPKTAKQKYNIITVYDWDGNYISRVNAKKGYEIESIYHVGSKYYAGFYRSYYKTTYKDVEKTVLVDGKTKKKKVKVKQKEYKRDNYVYQIKGI